MCTITPLADGRVAYVGDPVALVIADDRYIAEDAAALIDVEYEEEDPVVTIADARAGAPVHPRYRKQYRRADGRRGARRGVRGAAARRTAASVTHRVTHQRISQSPMETRGVVATRDGAEELILYITCQSPHMVARYVSLALGLPQTSIRVIAKDVGGSFGLKNHPWREEMSVIIAALLFGRPLKWIEDRVREPDRRQPGARTGDHADAPRSTPTASCIASHGDYSVNNGAYPQGADCNIAVHMFMWAAYKMPEYGFLTRGWYSNTVGLAAYRGPWAMESLVRETALDIAARQHRHRPDRDPAPQSGHAGGPAHDLVLHIRSRTSRRPNASRSCSRLRRARVSARSRPRRAKRGGISALASRPMSNRPDRPAASPTMTGELAQLRIEPTGKVTATMSTHRQGHGTATTMAQIIADRLGVAYEDVTVFEGDSSRGGFSPGAAGSRQGVIAGGAAIKACGNAGATR